MGCIGVLFVIIILLGMLFFGWTLEFAIFVLVCAVAAFMKEN